MSFVEVAGNNPIYSFYATKTAKKTGDILEGTFRGMREIAVKGKSATIADLEDTNGKVWSFWVPSVLHRKLEGVTPMSVVRIQYRGQTLDTPRGKAHDWKLEVKQ